MRRAVRASVVLASLALGLAACGRYGPPVRKPAPVSETQQQRAAEPAPAPPAEPQEAPR